MNLDNVVSKTILKNDQVIDKLNESLNTLRTGRASASMLDGVKVEAYGSLMPLKQLASVTAPEAQLIQVTPFDPTNLGAIAAAIRNDASLGFNPSDDGRVVRIVVPPLTEERRKELAKQIGQKQEEAMIVLRNNRHEAIDFINKSKNSKAISEDEAKRLISQIEDNIVKVRAKLESMAKAKESDILKI